MVNIDIQSLWANMPSPWINNNHFDWSCITKNLKPIFYKKNMIVFYQNEINDYIYLIKEGRVCLSTLNSFGKEKSFFIAEKGCVFGEISAIDNKPNFCSAITVANSYIYKIPKDIFIEELKSNSNLSLEIIKLMVKKMRLITTEIKQLSFNDSKYKVYYAILHLINQYSLQSSDKYYLTIKFTHQEMASLTGLSRVCVSQILSDLIKKKIIEKKGSNLIIKNLEPIVEYVINNN